MRILILLLFLMVCLPTNAFAELDFLTGERRLACEALLCLSSPHRPSECTPALSRYFGIKKKKWSKTRNARRKFLNLCPSAHEPGMPQVVNSVVHQKR